MHPPAAGTARRPTAALQRWATTGISGALALLSLLVIRSPALGERAQLHDAAGALARAIAAIERSYADSNLYLRDHHLALPGSARFCTQLRVRLPDSGHARLVCHLRPTADLRGTLMLQRSPDGTWRCRGEGMDEMLLPAHCRD